MLNKHSKMKAILKDEQGKLILQKYFGEKLKDPKMKMVMGFSLEKVGKMAKDQMPDGLVDKINKELIALSDEVTVDSEEIITSDSKIPLNKEWLFTKEDTDKLGNGIGYESVNIPHTWNAEDGNTGGSDYHRGLCTYKKSIVLGDELKGKKVFLEFGAVNSVATVYVNGIQVEKHIGGYSLFRVDITNVINLGSENTVVVKVDNSHIEEVYPLMADFTFFGGIYREVNIRIVDDIHFDLLDAGSPGVYISQKEVSYEKAIIGLEAIVVNESELIKEAKVCYKLFDMNNKLVDELELSSSVMHKTSFIQEMIIDEPTLWNSIKNPYLYSLETTLLVDNVIVDNRKTKVGLRFFEVDPKKGFLLNGESMKLNGVSRHQDRAISGWALSREEQEEDMILIKEIGANSIRLAHYQHNPYFYELCDKYGMVVWAEIPLISRSSKTDVTGENAKSQMVELVKQNYNYGSIVFWGVQNETTMAGKKNRIEEITTELHEMTKKMDPYRLTTQAQVGHHPDEDSMNHITDVLAYNKYFGWYYDSCEEFENWITSFTKTNPGISLGISEYGCEGILDYHTDTPECKDYTEEYQALYHEKVLQIFNKHPEIWGTYVWNMFDFASDLRDEGGVQGMNNKGLMTHDRKVRKDSFYYYKAMWSSEPLVHITSKRYEQRINDVIDIKIYTNEDDVTLIVNNEELESVKASNKIALFEGVKLIKGKNNIVAKTPSCQDEAVFLLVDELSVNYSCPKEAGGMMGNWFGDNFVLDEDIKPLEFPQGKFSVKDPIEDIISNPEGEAVLKKYLAPMFDHPMFDMAKSFNLKMIQDFDKESMSDTLLYNISKELNQISK